MSTANFEQHNARSIFVIEDEEFDEAYIDTKLNVSWELRSKLDVAQYALSNDGPNFMAIWVNDTFCGVDFTVTLELEMLCGYYAHHDLDYTIEVADDYQTANGNPADFDCGYAIYGKTGNQGLVKIHEDNFQKRIEKILGELQDQVEKVYETFTTKVNRVGRFSSGEAIYETA